MHLRWTKDQQQPRRGHTELSTQDSLEDLPSLLAASRELCGAMATQKLGKTVHAQPQASECKRDGAVPGKEVESRVRANTGSPPPGHAFLRAEGSWALSQTPHRLHGVRCVALAQLSSEEAPGLWL